MSQITPNGTNCGQFSSGTATTLTQATYTVSSNHMINGTSPGTFNYWVKVTAAAGSNTFVINQSITTGNFSTLFALTSGSAVFDSGCKSIKATFTQSSTNGATGTITATFNAASAGTCYIEVKLSTANIQGKPAPSPGSTVGYSYSTTGVAGSTAGLNLVLKH